MLIAKMLQPTENQRTYIFYHWYLANLLQMPNLLINQENCYLKATANCGKHMIHWLLNIQGSLKKHSNEETFQ